MAISKFRKKPVVIEAFQWKGESYSMTLAIKSMPAGTFTFDGTELLIDTLEGEMTAQPGDWIIKGVAGEYYPCKPEIFEATYESLETDDGN